MKFRRSQFSNASKFRTSAATFTSDRRKIADNRCAKNINELISYIYDTKRTITVIGRDDKTTVMVINDPSDPNSDVTIGKYGVTVDVGPASETKRTLANEQMMAFVNAMPQTLPWSWILSPKRRIGRRAANLPSASRWRSRRDVIPEDEMTPEMKAMQQQSQQKQALQDQLAQAHAEAEISAKSAKASSDEARAHLATAQAYKAILDAHSRAADVQGKNIERDGSADDKQLRQAMDMLDQHNDVISGDREHALAVAQAGSDHANKSLGTFADLATTDQDLRDLQRFRQGEANQENDPTGQTASAEGVNYNL
jgi:hypothetical protein